MKRLACALALVLVGSPAFAQLDDVGDISFPTSTQSAEAQQHFLRGVAILHSFGWKQAITEFQAAQKLDPDFAMAYWGETLCYNHPLMGTQDDTKPRAALERLGATREARLAKAPTAREKGLLDAVETLWGEDGDARARKVAYMHAMERLHREYPGDDEIAAFYAVALLSGARALDDDTFRYEMRAGAIGLDIFKRNPKHPGAVHYIIHAFDDPIHAPLALEAAHVYADIVPAVSHAIHMPTHIFIQHGMWKEVSEQNMRAFQVGKDLWETGDSPGDMAHSLDWGQYGFLQRGNYAKARENIETFEWMLETTGQQRARGGLDLVRARYIVETEEWKVQELEDDASNHAILANGLSAARTGDLAAAERAEAMLAGRVKTGAAAAETDPHAHHGSGAAALPPGELTEGEKSAVVMHREVAALVRLMKGETDEAVRLLEEAVRYEESLRPPNGAASPIKPAHELFGEVLLELNRPAEAAKMFDTCLLRMPGRARSLIGSARAHAAAGSRETAAERFATLRANWDGHSDLPEYREAERFLTTTMIER
jgi:tetratricopeptide (TPR) repeat protein